MSAPRHLWSGDWLDESSAMSEELAARRRRVKPPAEPEPEAPPPRRRQSLRDRLRALRPGTRGRRRLRVALLAALLTLLLAGGAYAVGSALSGGPNRQPAAAGNGARAWLGIDMASTPLGGVLVASVAPKSPAQAAGIHPGDVITQIDTQPMAAPSIVEAAIAGMQPGDHVEIQLQRGTSTLTVEATLAKQPAGRP